MNILELSHVEKRFGSKKVLSDVSFTVPKHCVFGFIGRNGAGKTTTMKSVLGLIPVDGGTISVCGEKVVFGNSPTNRHVGYLPDVPEFYGYMTAQEYLKLCGSITNMKASECEARSKELLELVGLVDEKHRIKGFSRGMKQRLGIAQALLNRPKLLICDEPTSALDPVGRREILDLLVAARGETSVVFSTHILSDVERICSHVAMLEDGKIMCSGTIDEIRQMRQDAPLELVPAADITEVAAYFPQAVIEGEKLVFENADAKAAEEIMQTLLKHHIPVTRLERCETNLEQLFMEVVQK